jgi:hypothetical protein
MTRGVACLVILTCATPAAAQPPSRDTSAATTGAGSIRGRVTNSAGHPIARAEVRAGPNAGQVEGRITLTDTDGRYEIANLPEGTYTIVVSKTDYVRTSWGEARPEGPGKRIPLADGQKLANMDVRVEHTGAIAGRIVDEFGDPVSDVFVQSMRYQYVQGSRRLLPSGRGGRSNDLGEFRIFGLTPGQYVVSATLRDFSANSSDTNDRSGYAPTFYPGTGNPADAQRVTIASGQTMTGITLPLLPIQTAKISGTVVDADGRPPANGFINVTAKSAATIMNLGVPLRNEGQFTVNGVPPGEYIVRAMNQNGSGADGAVAEVTVSGSDVSGLQLVMAKPSTIRGRIAFTASANGSSPPKPTAFDLGAVREWALGQPVRNPSKIKDDGTFEIALMTGHIQLRAAPVGPGQGVNGPPPGAPPPWRINRVMLNGVDVGDSGIDVPLNASIDDVVVEMTNHSSEATGSVTDANGKIVRDVFVIVFAQDASRWTVQTRWLAVSRPGLDDKFHARLLAGEYYAVAMSDVETNAWTDPDFLSLAREHATKFAIADGETKTIDLQLSPAPVF